MAKSYTKVITEAALSLVTDTVKSNFLGAEVQEKSEEELSLDSAWKALGRGEIAAAIQVCCDMIAKDRHNDKLFFTRAYAYARAGEWQWAMADYSAYLKIHEAAAKLLSSLKRTTFGNPTLANAYYGRALCLAKLGFHERALHDLNQCIRHGPVDEQMTEADVSLVPRAKVAKLVLKQAYPELAGADDAREAEAVAARKELEAARKAQGSAAGDASDEPVYEGKVWRVPITALEPALARVAAAGKTALLLDGTGERVTDMYFTYSEATVIEAKRVITDVRMAGVEVEAVREGLRQQLVHAMRWGHLLVLRMSNTAADFCGSYCAPETFPTQLFEAGTLPAGKDAAKDVVFAKVLRPADTGGGCGPLPVPPQFSVVVTSTFKPANYEALLQDSLPLQHLQPIEIFVPSEAARAAALAGEGATNSGPLSGIFADWGGAWNSTAARTTGDAPKAGQLQGDRTTLFLSN